MSSVLIVNPRFEALVRQHRLDRFDEVMGRCDGHKSNGHSGRDVTQLELDHRDKPIRLFVKREWHTHLKDCFIHWTSGIGWVTKGLREWHTLRTIMEAGIGCPEPVVVAQRGGIRPQGYLILCDLPDSRPLIEMLLKYGPSMDIRGRRQLAARLGHEVARLHEAGITHLDLYSKHIFLSDTAAGTADGTSTWIGNCRVSFIDLQRCTTGRDVSAAQRVVDLAAIDSTLPRELAGKTDRHAFLLSYLSHCSLPLEPSPFVWAIRRRVRILSGRSKIREMQHLRGE